METVMYLLTIIRPEGKEYFTAFPAKDGGAAVLAFLQSNKGAYKGFEVERIDVQGDKINSDSGIYEVQYMREDGHEWEHVYFTSMFHACTWVTECASQYNHIVSSIAEIPVMY